MMKNYILKGHTPVLEENILTWGEWLEKAERHVGNTIKKGIQVSTVFLGLNHRFGIGSPLFFETMVFGGKYDGEQERYSTWEEAEKGHERICNKVFQGEGKFE